MMRMGLLLAVVSMSVGVTGVRVAAQEDSSTKKSGYVTEVRGSHLFALNGLLIETGDATTYKSMDKKSDETAEQLQQAVQVGTYLQVQGSKDPVNHRLRASLVSVREDWEKELSGAGVIEKVMDAGAEPVFQADGYKIRITSSTELSLSNKMKSISEAGPGFWIRYKGMRDAKGVLVAEKARIVPAKFWWLGPPNSAEGEKAPRQLDVPRDGAVLDLEGNLVSPKTELDERDAGGSCGWYRVPPDAGLQDRVQNVGVRVVPAYLMKLEDKDKAKIHFRFYVVEEEKVRSELTCIPGLILVPRKVMERLQNDDQLAALLADGVAWNLQQLVSEAMQNKDAATLAASMAFAFAKAPLPVRGGMAVGGILVGHKLDKPLEEERGRIALELMAAGGYDPWQAPEAWRLLSGKNKGGSQPLVYPDRSGYQLGILNLQYAETRPASHFSTQ